MPKCPHCGSSAQVIGVNTEFRRYGDTLFIDRTYVCECYTSFVTREELKIDSKNAYLLKSWRK